MGFKFYFRACCLLSFVMFYHDYSLPCDFHPIALRYCRDPGLQTKQEAQSKGMWSGGKAKDRENIQHAVIHSSS